MDSVDVGRSNESSGEIPANLHSIYLVPVPWDWRFIIQLILAIVGILGNALVIHVYLNTSKKFTKSVTNTFIAALAAADLVTSICLIPIPTLSRIPDNVVGHIYCKLISSNFLMWVSILASVFSLTTLAIERYIAIAHPIRYKKLFTVKMTRLIIVMIWISSFVYNTFILYCNHVRNTVCVVDFGSAAFQMFIGVSTFIVKYLVPIIVMLFTNIRSIRLLKARSHAFIQSPQQMKKSPNLNLLRARQRVINMVFSVIVAFIVCWSPDQFAFLGWNLGIVPFEYIFLDLYRMFVLMAFANSCINPFLYALTNENFRQAIQQQVCRFKEQSNESSNDPFDTPLEMKDFSGPKGDRNCFSVSATASVTRELPTETIGQ